MRLIFGPLCNLWAQLESERSAHFEEAPDEEDPFESMSEKFHKVVLLLGQAMNSLNHHRYNFINTLFDNSTRVKDMLKSKSNLEDWDNIDNDLLFGEKFREELQKDSAAKLKSKKHLHWVEQSRKFFNIPQQAALSAGPFPSPLRGGKGQKSTFGFQGCSTTATIITTTTTEVRDHSPLIILSVQEFPIIHRALRNLFPVGAQKVMGPIAGRLKALLENWKILTQDPWTLQTIKGYQIPFLSTPIQNQLPLQLVSKEEEMCLVDHEVQEILSKGR